MSALTRLATSSAQRAALPERARMVTSLMVVVIVHVVGFVLLASAGPGFTALIALALVAYGRGLLHAVDLDHVTMIDNSIRKFIAEGRRPVSVGLAFSAGHSTVVMITSALVIMGVSAVTDALQDDSGVAGVLGIIGLAVSGAYLLFCAAANTPRLIQAIRAYRADGEMDAPGLRGGLLSWLAAAPLRWVRYPRHIYLVGVAFSLGFDTSSQIGLLVVVASATVADIPLFSLMALPLLFTAAMSLVDTLNGVYMLRLYSATDRPQRRLLAWNIAITSVSIVAALVVAVLAAGELLAEAGWDELSRVAGWLASEQSGFVLVGVFLVLGVIFYAADARRGRSTNRSGAK